MAIKKARVEKIDHIGKKTKTNPNTAKETIKQSSKLLSLIPLAAIAFSALFVILLIFISALFITHIHISKFPKSNNPTASLKETKHVPEEIQKNLNAQPSPAITYRVPILTYHYVEYVQDKRDTIRQSLNINPNVFEQQIKTLLDAGYTFMTSADFGMVLDGKEIMPQKPVIITIDDGHWDLATVVLPILEKYHVKVTAYIIPGLLGGSDFMTQKQLQDVVDSKLVDIGAHTVHHRALRGASESAATYEIVQSKVMLENTYKIHVVSFAFPYGSFDQQAINIVKAANFTTAVTTVPGIEQSQQNRFFLFRIKPGYKTGQALINYLNQNSFYIPPATPSATKKI